MRVLRDCKRLHLMHMRKAGGTTARRVLGHIAELHNIPFSATEGYPMSHSPIDEDTFLVANFRDPLERVCSLYNAEGHLQGVSDVEAVPPFAAWFDRTAKHHPPGVPGLWRSVNQYYVRSFCDTAGPNQPLMSGPLDSDDYKSALKNVQRIDLLMICEWFDDGPHRRYLTQGLLGSGRDLIRFPRANQTSDKHGMDIRRHLTDRECELIRAANNWDIELYKFVRWRAEQAALTVLHEV